MDCSSLAECVAAVIDHRGLTPKKLGGNWAEVGYRTISAKNIKDGKLVQVDSMHLVDEAMYHRWMSEEVERGDILITSEAPFGEVLFWDSDEKPVLSQRVFGLKPNKSICDSRYLYYWMKGPLFQGELHGRATGTTVIGLRQPELLKCSVLLPSLDAQKQIGLVLGRIDDAIALNTKLNGYLAELVSLEFMSRFSENVPTVELGQVLSISTKSLKPQDCFGEVWEHYSIPAYDEKHWPVFEPADGIKSNKYIVDKDCFLISKLNPTTKRIWMPACSSNRPVCSTEFIVYKPNEPKHKSFYYAAIDAPAFTDFLLAHVTGSTGSRQRTQPKATLAYPMPAPGTEAIEDFCAFADPIYEQIKTNELESKQLEELRDVLLPRLMSGKIDVSKIDLTQLNSHLA